MKNISPLLLVPNQILTRRYTTPVPPHYHRLWEIAVFESGEFNTIIDGKTYHATAGDVFLIGEPHLHELTFISGPNAYWDLYVSDNELQKICELISPDLYRQINSKEILVHFKLSSQRLQHLIRDLRELSNYELTIFKKDITHEISPSFLVHYLLGVYFNRQRMEDSQIADWFQTFLYNLQSPEFFCKNVSDIIDTTRYSHSQVAREFKEQTGTTLIDYLMYKRLEFSAELLLRTDLSILSIASQVGYDSLSFFIKLFKKIYGLTPLQYRKQRTSVILNK